MKVLGFDIETTGLDSNNDKVIELAMVLWDTEDKKPITMNSYFVYAKHVPEKIVSLTGISQDMLDNYGEVPHFAISHFHKQAKFADAYIAHNGIKFDVPFMQKLFRVEGAQWVDLPIIDTRTDLRFPPTVSSRKLEDIAEVYEIKNPYAHRALFDVLTMLQILSHHDIPGIIEKVTTSPFVTITASAYPGNGFWKWKEKKCYRRDAREIYADIEVHSLRRKMPRIKFEIVSQS